MGLFDWLFGKRKAEPSMGEKKRLHQLRALVDKAKNTSTFGSQRRTYDPSTNTINYSLERNFSYDDLINAIGRLAREDPKEATASRIDLLLELPHVRTNEAMDSHTVETVELTCAFLVGTTGVIYNPSVDSSTTTKNLPEQVLTALELDPETGRRKQQPAAIPGQDPIALYQEGLSLFEQGKFTDAAAILEKAQPLLPRSAPVHYTLAVTYSRISGECRARDNVNDETILPWDCKCAGSFKQALSVSRLYGGLNNQQLTHARDATIAYGRILVLRPRSPLSKEPSSDAANEPLKDNWIENLVCIYCGKKDPSFFRSPSSQIRELEGRETYVRCKECWTSACTGPNSLRPLEEFICIRSYPEHRRRNAVLRE